MSNQSGKIFILIAIAFLIVVIAINFLLKDPNKTQNSTLNTVRDESFIESKNFKMKLKVPGGFIYEDKFPVFKLSNNLGVIEIVRNGTNYLSLEEYLKDFDQKRGLRVLSSENLLVNDRVASKRDILENGEGRRSIYIFLGDHVYIFSSSTKDLYPILDQIVNSFEPLNY